MGGLYSSERGACACLFSHKITPASENADVIIIDNGKIRTDNPVSNGRNAVLHPAINNPAGHIPIAPLAYVNAASVGSDIFEKFTKYTCPMCLVVIGLDDAGKTSFAQTVMHRHPPRGRNPIRESRAENVMEDPKPTLGFSKERLCFRKHDVVLHDLGGRATIRGIWRNYFAEAHGIVLVVDASMHVTSPKWDELNQVLSSLTETELVGLQGKPTVILLNKQDVKPNINESELQARVDIKEFLEKYSIPYKVFPVCIREKELIRSAPMKRQLCWKNLEESLMWIVRRIEDSYPSLHMKVQLDSRHQIEQEEEERQERMLRFKAAREAAENDAADDDDNIVPETFIPLAEHLQRIEKETIAVKNDVNTALNDSSTVRVNVPNGINHTASTVQQPAPSKSTLSISKSEPNLKMIAEDAASEDVVIDPVVNTTTTPTSKQTDTKWPSVINLKALHNDDVPDVPPDNGDIIISDTEDVVQIYKPKLSRPPLYKRMADNITRKRLSLPNGIL
ncbi:ADP-ribosylation factor-like protein 13B [Paramacrobiotus metropolitanus]|uniref:ADP-ribosylation factor-like protein 13B n=1 Tax=Paramacrobiotus metropolitanus TaxID=2943436 RepID=UPI0024456D6A|nr:ADP-ribosylation factor-like protein 13B [Paramacrobiotus metropolitanus]XP_055332813.1 ADP-ribosylation factor-like protein 13B [Paramacrobiotus metropolitanus]